MRPKAPSTVRSPSAHSDEHFGTATGTRRHHTWGERHKQGKAGASGKGSPSLPPCPLIWLQQPSNQADRRLPSEETKPEDSNVWRRANETHESPPSSESDKETSPPVTQVSIFSVLFVRTNKQPRGTRDWERVSSTKERNQGTRARRGGHGKQKTRREQSLQLPESYL